MNPQQVEDFVDNLRSTFSLLEVCVLQISFWPLHAIGTDDSNNIRYRWHCSRRWARNKSLLRYSSWR